MNKPNTKSKIVEIATKLFNEHGVKATSTNHIAKEMNISPGNLYHHFNNKEQIIRAILDEMIVKMDEIWKTNTTRIPGHQIFFNQLMMLFSEYKFFQFEIVSLIQRDPLLKEKYRNLQNMRFKEMMSFFKYLQKIKILQKLDDDKLDQLVKSCWIITDGWLSFLYIQDRTFTSKNFAEGIKLSFQIIDPYLTKKGQLEKPNFD